MVDMMNMDDGGWDESLFDDIAGDIPDFIKRITFLIDRSGSMDGITIGTVNSVMEELLSELDEHRVRIAVAEVDEQVEWKTEQPVTLSQFSTWERTRSNSFSNLGEAFSQLADKLTKSEWQEQGTNGSQDYFVLFSDGLATDDYQTGLRALAGTPAFQSGKRLAINFSDIENPELLRSFAGDQKNVIHVSGNSGIDVVEHAILEMVK